MIAGLLKQLKFDVLHVQMPYSPLFAGRIINSAPPKTKIIGTFHILPLSWLHSTGARSLELLNRHTLSQFDQVISVSQPAADFARSVFGIESVIIPNATNIKQMHHKPIYSKTLKVIFLGRLVQRKGCHLLLKCLFQLQKQYQGRYQVIIGGQGPLRPKLEDYAAKHKIKKLKFIGFVDEKDKPALLASADIAVFPSTGGESFGISIIEAMAAGSRVILGGDNAGYQGILADYPDLLIDPKDTIGFANRLQYFLEHESVRKDAHKWAKANIGQYDISVVGKRILAVYRKDL